MRQSQACGRHAPDRRRPGADRGLLQAGGSTPCCTSGCATWPCSSGRSSCASGPSSSSPALSTSWMPCGCRCMRPRSCSWPGVLWLNRSQPGLLLVMVGVLANGLAVVVNGGWMPVYLPALDVAGLTTLDLSPTYHVALPADIGLAFLLQAGPLGDIIPFPAPILANVVSIGDVLISIGLGWFVLATLLRRDAQPAVGGISLWRGGASVEPAADPSVDSMVDRSCSAAAGGRDCWHRNRSQARWRRSQIPAHPGCRGANGSAPIHTSDCSATPGSVRSGSARPSACSATDCTRSPWASWSMGPRAHPWPPASCSSLPRCPTCCWVPSLERSWTAGSTSA